jgi:hypothetical protein
MLFDEDGSLRRGIIANEASLGNRPQGDATNHFSPERRVLPNFTAKLCGREALMEPGVSAGGRIARFQLAFDRLAGFITENAPGAIFHQKCGGFLA